MLLVGCSPESPGFQMVHYVQWELGLTRKHWSRFLFSVDVLEGGKKKPWYPNEDPGCSRGFDKMYRHYMKKNALKIGTIGDAYSLMVSANVAYETDKEIISANPRSVLCDHLDCIQCRVLNAYNLRAAPMAIIRNIVKILTGGKCMPSKKYHNENP